MDMEGPDPARAPDEEATPGAAPAADGGPPARVEGGPGVPGPPEPRKGNPLDRVPGYTVPAILLGVPALVAILSWLFPKAVYQGFVWRYYWGPIVADARGQRFACSVEPSVSTQLRCDELGGYLAKSGYTVVNTLTWALLLGLLILGTAQLLNRLRTPMDNRLILAASAWVVSGSIWHVLEDVGLLEAPLQYLFITPPIYLLFAAFGVLSMLMGHYLLAVERRLGTEAALQKLWFLMSVMVLGWTAVWAADWNQIVHYANPLWFAGFTLLTFFLVRWRVAATGRLDPTELTGLMAIPSFLLSLVYLGGFLRDVWGRGPGADALPSAWLIATGGAAAVCLAVYGLARLGHGEVAAAFRRPINLFVIFAHALDGLATAIGIDFIGGYEEKHVVSEWIRQAAESLGATYPTLMAFFPVKVLVALAVVYGIDVYSKEDLQRNPTVMGLVKFAVIMVGLGPGVRNMVRMSLGL